MCLIEAYFYTFALRSVYGIRVNQMRNYLTIQGEGNAGVTLISSYT